MPASPGWGWAGRSTGDGSGQTQVEGKAAGWVPRPFRPAPAAGRGSRLRGDTLGSGTCPDSGNPSLILVRYAQALLPARAGRRHDGSLPGGGLRWHRPRLGQRRHADPQRGAPPRGGGRGGARAGLRRAARGDPGARPEPGPHRRDRGAAAAPPTRACAPCRTRPAAPPPRSTPPSPPPAPTSSCASTATACSTADYVRTAVAPAGGDGRGQRRRPDGRRGRHGVRAGRRGGDDLAARGRVVPVPHRRSGRAGRHRLPRRVPPRVADPPGRLRRPLRPRPGLGAQPPHPRGRRAGVVLPVAAGELPAAGHRCGRSPGSTATTAAGAGSSPGSTAARSTRATWRRRRCWSPCRRVRWAGSSGAPLWARARRLPRRDDRRRARRQGRRRGRERLWLPAILPTMHLSLGLGLPHQPALARPRRPRRPGLTGRYGDAARRRPPGPRVAPQQQEAPRAH